MKTLPSFLHMILLSVNLLCYSEKFPQCIFLASIDFFIGSEDVCVFFFFLIFQVFPLKKLFKVLVTGP